MKRAFDERRCMKPGSVAMASQFATSMSSCAVSSWEGFEPVRPNGAMSVGAADSGVRSEASGAGMIAAQ